MSQETHKILEMLQQGKIAVDDAEKLLKALKEEPIPTSSPVATPGTKAKFHYLMVNVHEVDPQGKEVEKVNIRVPFQVLRAGVKLASLLPAHVKGKVNQALSEQGLGYDFDNLKPENLEELINALGEMTVEVNDENDKVRIYCV